MLRVLPPMFEHVNNLICRKTGLMWVVKRATPLFNSFCSNVAKQVARFCSPFFRTLRQVTFFHDPDSFCFTYRTMSFIICILKILKVTGMLDEKFKLNPRETSVGVAQA